MSGKKYRKFSMQNNQSFYNFSIAISLRPTVGRSGSLNKINICERPSSMLKINSERRNLDNGIKYQKRYFSTLTVNFLKLRNNADSGGSIIWTNQKRKVNGQIIKILNY